MAWTSEGNRSVGKQGVVSVTQPARYGLLDRLRSLRAVWRDIAGGARDGDMPVVHPDVSDDDAGHLREHMRACLEGRGGEVSARARAAGLGRAYLSLSEAGRQRFLGIMTHDFGPDRARVDEAATRLLDAGDEAERRRAERGLRQALEAPRRRLLTQFNALPDGVKFLVDLRADLLVLERTDPDLAELEADLKALLASWFDVGFLELHRLTWRSPALLLEKIMAYEAVHEIRSWEDLKNRLDSDRRLYGFFHPRMPDEPLIFVEVALTKGIAANVQALLDETAPVDDPIEADTAIFYSISNAQRGLAGISFGGFLIKRVVDALRQEFPNLKAFATLSPIPGFARWLDARLRDGETGLLGQAERRALQRATEAGGGKGALKALLARPDWHRDATAAEALRAPLMRLCARYLLKEKKADGIRAMDPVAHFHLSNGARMERLNWLGDMSPKGIAESHGLMMNYLYRLDEIESNHEAYSGQGRIAASNSLLDLARKTPPR